jgi:hypothetical protein
MADSGAALYNPAYQIRRGGGSKRERLKSDRSSLSINASTADNMGFGGDFIQRPCGGGLGRFTSNGRRSGGYSFHIGIAPNSTFPQSFRGEEVLK